MTQEELRLVLEALKWCHGGEPCGTAEAIAVVEKALAQRTDQNFCSRCGKRTKDIHTCTPPQRTEQEPVANYCKECLTYNGHHEGCSHYTTPPQRKWVGLTGGEISNMFGDWPFKYGEFAEAIEARLKEKNGYAEEKNT